MSKSSDNAGGASDTIQVYCRVRPVSENHCQYLIEQSFDNAVLRFKKPRSGESGYVNNTIENYEYKFSGIFDQQVDQDEIFDRCARKCVMSALEGYNSTIFAYGQSGSGKTYTMTGGDGSYEKRGIIPRAISLLFEESEGNRDREYSFSVSYMEIYKGYGYDLLSDKRDVMEIKDLPKVSARLDTSGIVVFKNLQSFVTKSEEDALDKLFIGDKNRVLSETMLNESSTRSHCVFTISIESKEPGSSVVKASKLHMVDLAGSERVGKTNSSGNTLVEARSINLSLHFLEHFITSISEGKDFIPWRDSLITTVLKDSIGGNCKTVMISTINPSHRHMSESVSTCKFSMRVASIKQSAVINEKVDPYVQIRKLKKKVEELEEELKFYRNGSSGERREALDGNEKAIIKEKVDEFIDDLDRDVSLNLGGDHLRIREAFQLMKSYVVELRKQSKQQSSTATKATSKKSEASPPIAIPQTKPAVQQQQSLSDDILDKLKNLSVAIELRDIEIDILVSMLNKKQKNMSEVSIQTDQSSSSLQQLQQQVLTNLPPPSPKRFNSNHPSQQPQQLHTFVNNSSSSIESIANIHRSSQQSSSSLVERKPIQDVITKESIRERIKEKEKSILSQTGDLAPKISNEKIAILADATGMKRRAEAFELFRQKYRNYNVIEKNKETLGEKISLAKELAREINDKKAVIDNLKNRLIQLRTERAAQNLLDSNNKNSEQDEFPEEVEIKREILSEKDLHQQRFNELKEMKKEIEHLKRVLEMSRVRLNQDFENWYKTTNPFGDGDGGDVGDDNGGGDDNGSTVSSLSSTITNSSSSNVVSSSSLASSRYGSGNQLSSFDASSSPRSSINSNLQQLSSSSSRNGSTSVKQAWGDENVSPNSGTQLPTAVRSSNMNRQPQQQQQQQPGFSDENPFFKKLKEHVELSSNSNSHNSSNNKRVSLLQQAYKL